jgi:hypothetical protein
MHLLLDWNYVNMSVLLDLGASTFYYFAIIWPSMVSTVYAEGREIWAGYMACLVGACVTLGLPAGGLAAGFLGHF